MRWALALLLGACAQTGPSPGDDVPAAEVAQAAAEIALCVGRAPDLDGWRFVYAAQEDEQGRFWCGGATSCGPLPPGCRNPSECPCRCKGLTDYLRRVVTVSLDGAALWHELKHAGWGVVDHRGPIWSCPGG